MDSEGIFCSMKLRGYFMNIIYVVISLVIILVSFHTKKKEEHKKKVAPEKKVGNLLQKINQSLESFHDLNEPEVKEEKTERRKEGLIEERMEEDKQNVLLEKEPNVEKRAFITERYELPKKNGIGEIKTLDMLSLGEIPDYASSLLEVEQNDDLDSLMDYDFDTFDLDISLPIQEDMEYDHSIRQYEERDVASILEKFEIEDVTDFKK